MYLHVSTYPGVSTHIYANDTILNTNYLRREGNYTEIHVSTGIYAYPGVSTHIITCVSRAILAIDLNHKSAQMSLHI